MACNADASRPPSAFKRPSRPATAGSIGALVGRPPRPAEVRHEPGDHHQVQPQCQRPHTAGAHGSAGFGLGRPRSSTAGRRPSTAGSFDGRRTGNLQRSASAPTLLDSEAHAGAAYRSPSLALEVKLRERLAQVRGSAGKVSEEQLRIYHELFEEIIASSQVHADLLSKVKAAYDHCVSPWVVLGAQDQGLSPAPARTGLAELELEVALAPRIAELQQENRRLREAAGILHRERLKRIQESQSPGAFESSSAASGAASRLADKKKAQPAWSGMRVTSDGVRGNHF
eukprot:TRINITY_DN55295_c0_g1_i1.p1 TRINITY_DN55295_c0_g1~~TRINITY_DN55295_c0_g1_i1.p1  ORF type:complete len:292 (+),score=58.05 TRINITY_DN55295_c0_g1_i1:24-878(+)